MLVVRTRLALCTLVVLLAGCGSDDASDGTSAFERLIAASAAGAVLLLKGMNWA